MLVCWSHLGNLNSSTCVNQFALTNCQERVQRYKLTGLDLVCTHCDQRESGKPFYYANCNELCLSQINYHKVNYGRICVFAAHAKQLQINL